jgi:hypothetical protein
MFWRELHEDNTELVATSRLNGESQPPRPYRADACQSSRPAKTPCVRFKDGARTPRYSPQSSEAMPAVDVENHRCPSRLRTQVTRPPPRVTVIQATCAITGASATMPPPSEKHCHGPLGLLGALYLFGRSSLVLLRHKLGCVLREVMRAQQGHLDRVCANATTMLRRKVAIEFGI